MAKTLMAMVVAMVFMASPAHGQTPKRGGVFRVPALEAPTLDPHLNAGFVTQVCICRCGHATSSTRPT